MVVIYKKTGGSYFLLINIYRATMEKQLVRVLLNKVTTILSALETMLYLRLI